VPAGPTLRYEGISPKAYEHPADRAATAALHSIPLMDQLIKRLCDFGHERRLRQVLLGNAVRIGDDQLVDLWAGTDTVPTFSTWSSRPTCTSLRHRW
jgi:hypothetical protein